MNKKVLSIALTIILMLSVIPVGLFNITVSAETTFDGFDYEINFDQVEITGYEGSENNLIIPSEIEGYPVTSIGDLAFRYDTELTNIIIPENVTNIGDRAFSDCYGLENVIIPNSVTRIGVEAFSACYRLTNVTISSFVTDIGVGAFKQCFDLENIIVDESNEFYSSVDGVLFNKDKTILMAYPGGNSRRSYIIPESVIEISMHAFDDYNGNLFLSSVTIPRSVISINNNAFSSNLFFYCYKNSAAANYVTNNNCDYVYLDGTDEESIVSGKIGKLNWSLDKRTGVFNISGKGDMIDFYGVKPPWVNQGSEDLGLYDRYITSVVFSDSITKIGAYAFNECYNLTSVTIGNNVKSIGERAFSYTDLIEVNIPDSVTKIDARAFYYCERLKSVILSKNLESTGNSAFENCFSLENINIPYGVRIIDNYTFESCSNLKNITLPNSVIEIGSFAFSECYTLENITIPYSVKNIYNGAFYRCEDLKNVVIYSTDCEFVESCGLNYTNTIYGFKGSTAEAFAEKIGAEFVDIMTIHSHSFDKGVITKKATCKATGAKTYTCTVCKSTKTETIAKSTTHTYSNNCDKSCNVCGKTRTVGAHNYSNSCDTTCNYCNAKRTIKHTYTNACDTTCNVCKANRTIKHTYSNNCDTSCNVCKSTRTITHAYKTTTTKATLTKNGSIVKKCMVCGKVASNTAIKYAKTFKLSTTAYTYTGGVKTPTVAVKDSSGKTLKKNTDYTVTYASGRKNAGTYKVTVKMIGKYSGTKTLTFKINPAKISSYKLSATAYTYDGKVKKPTVTVKNSSGTKLTTSSYTVTYASGRKNVGTYKVTIKGKGNYSGTKTLTFKISPAKTTVSKLTAGKKSITVAITKKSTQVTGYQIQYSTSKTFSKAKTKTISSYKTTKYTLKSLSAKKTYYVRVRTYKKVGSTTYYSGWSTYKYVKTK